MKNEEKLYRAIIKETCKGLRETVSMTWGQRSLCLFKLAVSMIGLSKSMLELQIKQYEEIRS